MVSMRMKEYASFLGAVFMVLVLGFIAGASYINHNRAKVGGDRVPLSLTCHEDEAIAYDPRDPGPRDLKCVHYDILAVQR